MSALGRRSRVFAALDGRPSALTGLSERTGTITKGFDVAFGARWASVNALRRYSHYVLHMPHVCSEGAIVAVRGVDDEVAYVRYSGVEGFLPFVWMRFDPL